MMWNKWFPALALVSLVSACDNNSCISGTEITAADLSLSVTGSPTKMLNFSWRDVGADDYVLCKDNAGTCEEIAVIVPPATLANQAALSAKSALSSTLTYTYYLDTLIQPEDDDLFYIRARTEGENLDSETVLITYKSFETIVGQYEPQIPTIGQNHGHAIAVSGDGLTMAISTLVSGDSNVNGGEVTVYNRGNDGWEKQAVLTSSVAASDPITGFGFDLDINDDGSVIVVSGWKQEVSAVTNAGAAYVFSLSGGTWSNTAVIENPAPTASDFFSSSVSISGDGTLLAIGAYNEDSNGTTVSNALPANDLASNSGGVYLYELSGGTWNFIWLFKASNADNFDFFGRKVRLAKSGEVLLITASGEDSYTGSPTDNSVFSVGSAYVFRKQPDNSWVEESYLKSTLPIKFSGFGEAAAISHAGDIVAIGVSKESTVASTDNTGVDLLGAVHIWHYDGSNWVHHARLTASNAEDGDSFGTSVAIGNNGKWLAVGAQYEDSTGIGIDPDENGNLGNNAGAAYIFELNGTWIQTHYLKSPETTDLNYFGKAIAFSAIKKELLIGAPSAPVDSVSAGKVYLF